MAIKLEDYADCMKEAAPEVLEILEAQFQEIGRAHV